MTTAVRVAVTLVAVLATHSFVSIFGAALLPGSTPFWIGTLIALLADVLVGWFVWTQSAAPGRGLLRTILLSAIATFAIGFVIGFFGPILLGGGNQGPLLGLFITGPLGFVFGAVGGAVYWLIQRRERDAADAVQP